MNENFVGFMELVHQYFKTRCYRIHNVQVRCKNLYLILLSLSQLNMFKTKQKQCLNEGIHRCED